MKQLVSMEAKLMRLRAVQVSRRVLYVNVTATLGVNVPPNASPDDVRSALDVTNLSADDPIAMLAANPDRFFGRTSMVCSSPWQPHCNHLSSAQVMRLCG